MSDQIPPTPEPPLDPEREALRDRIRQALAGSQYGYYDGEPIPSSREELVRRLQEGQPTPRVWTPETPGVVPPWTVPYLFDAFREHGLRRGRRLVMVWGGVLLLVLGWAAAVGELRLGTPATFFAFLAGLLLLSSISSYRTFARLTPGALREEVRDVRARPLPRSGPAHYTRLLGGAVIAVFLVQLLTLRAGNGMDSLWAFNSSALAVGIDREMVWQGEWWRLLTGELVHGNPLHLVMNLLALTALGRLLEAYAHRAYVPLAFLLSALGASAASVALTPGGLSVGSSGGIMGMFGFLAVMALRRRRLMPPGIGQAVLVNVGIIAGMGIVGYTFIDNAAHAGGLLAGGILGLLSVPAAGEEPYWTPGRIARAAGDLSLGILLLAALATIAILLVPLL